VEELDTPPSRISTPGSSRKIAERRGSTRSGGGVSVEILDTANATAGGARRVALVLTSIVVVH